MLNRLKTIWNKIKYRSNVTAYAKKIDVKIGTNNRFIGFPDFGTEPWLITIGNDCVFSSNITFITHDGSVNTIRRLDPKYKNILKFGKIVIGDNVFVGRGTTIMPNVKIGNNVVIALGSVVTKDIPEGMVVAGVPAKPICKTSELAEKLYKNSIEIDINETDKKIVSTKVANYYFHIFKI